MSGHEEAEGFVAGWQQRWPEWSIAEAFVPAPQRPVATAWLALSGTLCEAAWGGVEPTPGLAKLAWWHEELEGWAKGARRHPLGTVLQPLPAPWAPLARALAGLSDTRGHPPEQALEALAPLAAAIAAAESALFTEAAASADRAATSVGLALLGERALLVAGQEDAGWLLERWPRPAAGPLPRRLHSALLRQRLQALAAGKPALPASGWRVLGLSWRASRGR